MGYIWREIEQIWGIQSWTMPKANIKENKMREREREREMQQDCNQVKGKQQCTHMRKSI